MTLYGLILFPCLAVGLSISSLPTFVWEDQVAEGLVPLLRIRFQDGKADDFAVLKSFNPIPQHALEREEDIDACIYEGFLMNEADSFVTVTGCPHSSNIQVQLVSKRVNQQFFVVEDGQVQFAEQRMHDMSMDLVKVPEFNPENINIPDQQLAADGYIIKIKLAYDDNWKEKFGADSLNAMRRILAHAQNMWKYPSAPAKLYFDVDPDVRQLPGRWTTSGSIEEVSTNNLDSVNTNIYFCIRNANSGSAFGRAYLGGACVPSVQHKTAIQEWEHNDIITAQALAHEIGHNTGMSHDFIGTKEVTRFDSKGQPCTKVGGIMDYWLDKVNDASLWSTCSLEDMTKLLAKYPECMSPATSSNIPQTTPSALTPLDCKMSSSLSNLRGVHFLKLNGYSSVLLCVSGVCSPKAVIGVTNACKYICGKDSCEDAVDPGVCDLKKQLNGYTGSQFYCVNSKAISLTCTGGMCSPSYPPYTNSCSAICGSTSCESAVVASDDTCI